MIDCGLITSVLFLLLSGVFVGRMWSMKRERGLKTHVEKLERSLDRQQKENIRRKKEKADALLKAGEES